MSADTERLVVMLEARITEFEKRMKKAEGTGTRSFRGLQRSSAFATRAMERDMISSTNRINQALAATSAKIGAFGKAFAGGLVGGAAATVLAGFTTNLAQTVEALAQVGDEAKRAGLGVEEFQKWKFVADQNRIGIDALVDGFKELNLRADEFVVTGGGSAAESFERLGYSGAELAEKLKDPSELMLEIIGRLGALDTAAQIRISDELFGGSAGERFVELLGQGEDALRATGERAVEVGAVLDTEMIEKAAKLNARWKEITASVGGYFQAIIIGAAEVAGLVDSPIDSLLTLPPTEAAEAEIEGIREEINALSDSAVEVVAELRMAATAMAGLGNMDASNALNALADRMQAANQSFQDGTTDAESLRVSLANVTADTSKAITAMSELDQARLSGVTSAVASLAAWISEIPSLAALAKAAVASLDGDVMAGGPSDMEADARARRLDPITLAPTNKVRPKPAPTNIDFGVPDIPTGGSSGGGGASETNELLQEAERLFEATRTEAEKYATELEKLNEMQRLGYIDADTYARAIEDLGEQYGTTGRISESFKSDILDIIDGTLSAADAFDQLRKEIIRAAAEYLLFGGNPLGAGGSMENSLLGGIVSAFSSFDGGGYTGSGSRSGGVDGKGGFMAVMHPQETVIDHTKGQGTASSSGPVEVMVSGGNLTLTDDGTIAAKIEVRAREAERKGAAEGTRATFQQMQKSKAGWR